MHTDRWEGSAFQTLVLELEVPHTPPHFVEVEAPQVPPPMKNWKLNPLEELELSHFFEELPHPNIKIFLFDCVPYFDPNNIKSRISPGRISGAPGVVGLTHGEDAAAEFNGVNATADERKKGE